MVFVTTFYCHRTSLCFAGDNTKFTDFNTHCCPKIRLCGWQNASHFTLVYLVVSLTVHNLVLQIHSQALLFVNISKILNPTNKSFAKYQLEIFK